MEVVLNKEELNKTVKKLAVDIKDRNADLSTIIFAGIQQGGAVIGKDIIDELQQILPQQSLNYGQLDITFYRDDLRKEILHPDTMNMPFDIEGKTVILIDDVLFTGRTIKAALDTLLDMGRPDKVELCVLIDRKEHRQFPIQADYVGKALETKKSDKIKLVNGEVILL